MAFPMQRLATATPAGGRDAGLATGRHILANDGQSDPRAAMIDRSIHGGETQQGRTPDTAKAAMASAGDFQAQPSSSVAAAPPHQARSQMLASTVADKPGPALQTANLPQATSAVATNGHARPQDAPAAESPRPSDDQATAPVVMPVQIEPAAALMTAAAPVVAQSAAAAAPASPEPPQVPADQVRPELISLAAHADGSNEMTVSLHPRDLGEVRIHVARGADGSTAVTVEASQSQTLQDLSQSAHHLHAALDAAHVPAEGRTMSFVAAAAMAPDPQGQSTPSSPSAYNGDTSGGQQQAWRRDLNRQATRHGQTGSDATRSAAPVAGRRQWRLNELNITA